MGNRIQNSTNSKKQLDQVQKMLRDIQDLQRKELLAVVEISRYLNNIMQGGSPFRDNGTQYKSFIKDLAPGLFDHIDRMRKVLQFLRDGEEGERSNLIAELPDLEFMKLVELAKHPELTDTEIDDYIQRYIRDIKQSSLPKKDKGRQHGIRAMQEELKG
jgi:hypothetical protein